MRVIENMLLTEEGWRQLHEELLSLREKQSWRTSEYRTDLDGTDPGDAGPRCLESEIATVDRRILELEVTLARAVPVGPVDREPGVVGVGSVVSVRWQEGDEESYVLVGPPEVDVQVNRISYESPVGRALAGRSAGEWIDVSTPGGESRLEILKVG